MAGDSAGASSACAALFSSATLVTSEIEDISNA
jgi:hypothetical protein